MSGGTSIGQLMSSPTAEELERASFRSSTKDGDYFILPRDHVWFIPIDGEPNYILAEEYPDEITEEFERRLRLLKSADRLASLADDRATYLHLQGDGSAKLAKLECLKLLEAVTLLGQHSAILRLILEGGNKGPPKTAEILKLKQLLAERGFNLTILSPRTTPSGVGQPDPRITYVPWVISTRNI